MGNLEKYSNNKVALLTIAPFPNGNVSTLRYSSYLKALNMSNVDTRLLIYSPTSMAFGQRDRTGSIDGICYQYASIPYWGDIMIVKRPFYLLAGLVYCAKYLKKYAPDAIILYGDNHFFITAYFRLIATLINARFIGDRSELPTVKERKSKIRLFFYNHKQKWFDSMIIMTKQLCKYYSALSSKKNFVFFMPMTIDIERFKGIIPNKRNYIAVVFGTHNRDGLSDSLVAYIDYVKRLGGRYDLLIVGNYKKMPNRDDLDKIINESGISDRIKVHGPAELKDIPQILADASCLLTTPTTYISGGFPTKLGEYMLSGTPIVCTIAGELLDYIEPGKDMLMCYPTELEKVSDYLYYIECNPVEASQLAANAKKKALHFFDANTYVSELKSFLFNEQ